MSSSLCVRLALALCPDQRYGDALSGSRHRGQVAERGARPRIIMQLPPHPDRKRLHTSTAGRRCFVLMRLGVLPFKESFSCAEWVPRLVRGVRLQSSSARSRSPRHASACPRDRSRPPHLFSPPRRPAHNLPSGATANREFEPRFHECERLAARPRRRTVSHERGAAPNRVTARRAVSSWRSTSLSNGRPPRRV